MNININDIDNHFQLKSVFKMQIGGVPLREDKPKSCIASPNREGQGVFARKRLFHLLDCDKINQLRPNRLFFSPAVQFNTLSF